MEQVIELLVFSTHLRESNIWGLNYVGVLPAVTLIRANLHDFIDCQRLLLETEPHEIYHLAAAEQCFGLFSRTRDDYEGKYSAGDQSPRGHSDTKQQDSFLSRFE